MLNGVKKFLALIEGSLLIFAIVSFSYVIYLSDGVDASGFSEPTYCCERTKSGNYCINAPENQCDGNYRSAPTSCETTSYCRLGTCYDSSEGICMGNTPQILCEKSGGSWDPRPMEEVPQCQLGCCIIRDQAAFVSLVRCKRLSTFFGVENNYRTDIKDEVQCMETAQAQDMGACVYEKDFERLCKFTTRADCGAESVTGANSSNSSSRRFYKDYLCSAEELNTACARQAKTGCYNGMVYWFDSCGNRENVYSSDKVKSWNNGKVLKPDQVCSPNDGSKKDCGNCDYLLGSRCAEFSGVTGRPTYGNYFCKRTDCVDRNGKTRMNGESWCVHDGPSGGGKEQVGSRYYREVCVDGQVRVEPCADFRNEICIENQIDTEKGKFSSAACRVNRWQDCIFQTDEEDCLNRDVRECIWLPAVKGMIISGGDSEDSGGVVGFSNPTNQTAFSNPTNPGGITGRAISPITGSFLGLGGDKKEDKKEEKTITNRPSGICVPNYAPGLDFWNSKGSSKTICGQASAKCIVVYEKKLLGSEKCVKNCECLEESWALQANRVCVALGDCGGYVNYNNQYTDRGYLWKVDGKKTKFSPSVDNVIKKGFSGMAVATLFKIPSSLSFSSKAGMLVPTSAAGASSGTKLAGSLATTDLSLTSEMIGKLGASASGLSEGSATVAYMTDGSVKIIQGSNTVSIAAGQQAANALGAMGLKYQYEPSSWLAKFFGVKTPGMDAVVSGIQWAAVAYGAGYLIGNLLGMSKDNTKALAISMAAGFGVYKSLSVLKEAGMLDKFGFLGQNPMLVGAAVGITLFLLMYKKVETKVVTFDCLPWQAPTGVDSKTCEICNDKNLPCSEYRCKSLGASCAIVNKGSSNEKCVNVNIGDTKPPIIKPDEKELTYGYSYTNVKTSPPSHGFRIVNKNSSDGCLKAFTPFKFGITLDEPAECKIDINHTQKFDDMANYMGGSNAFSYNHSEELLLPGAKELKERGFVLEGGKDMVLYIRCRDAAGNTNDAEFAVRFCVDQAPDTTAPEIRATSVLNGGCVAEGSDSAIVDFYTNEPAVCRWSKSDQSYSNMQNEMVCSGNVYQINAQKLFTCRANLTGIGRNLTNFYVRCKDKPGAPENERNENQQSFVFSLRGSSELKIMRIKPNETIFGRINPSPVELYVETGFGCDRGKAVCFYSRTDREKDYIMFFDTGKDDGIHTQRLDLRAGNHKYYIKCVDSGGNLAKGVADFKLEIDTSAPVIARIYEQDGMLTIVTLRNSECAYSTKDCDFRFEEGIEMPYANTTVHVANWNKDQTYYIKCKDDFGREEASCSAIVKPMSKLF